MSTMFSSGRRASLAAALASAALGLSACAGGGAGGPGGYGYGGLGSPGVGTAAGALGGAAVGRAVAGRNDNLAAILGGAALGGLAGNVFGDRPSENRRQQQVEASRDAEQARRLDYERQSALQQEAVRKQIEEQRLFDEWKSSRGAGAASPAAVQSGAVSAPGDVMTAQRLLTALGYYRGPIDGVNGGQTRSAVIQFEQAQGLPTTGVVTPALVSRMRSVL
jgi:hypothetical protein